MWDWTFFVCVCVLLPFSWMKTNLVLMSGFCFDTWNLKAHIQMHISYVYWTMHHHDSWVKRDQLDVTCFIISLFNAQRVSDVNTSILRSLRLMCWVISWVVLIWFDVCWCYVVVWLSWCGIRMQVEALRTSASTCIWIPHHHSHTTT